ncbi:hypothetical protein C1645_823022 [Glomus cerebriforme]|uniref:Uncharacterized protein n=1 Tax=Glomus cerebriforme TaxID=658196 RepID=A0A397SXM8_9GLOM|nr:hypothetical protein C1645_823022 [Glomus cerebriforme]
MSTEEREGEVEEEGEERETYLVMQCQVRETSSSAICGKEYSRKDSFTDWIISDSQPLCIVKSEALRHFIQELDPAFIMPSQETHVIVKVILE